MMAAQSHDGLRLGRRRRRARLYYIAAQRQPALRLAGWGILVFGEATGELEGHLKARMCFQVTLVLVGSGLGGRVRSLGLDRESRSRSLHGLGLGRIRKRDGDVNGGPGGGAAVCERGPGGQQKSAWRATEIAIKFSSLRFYAVGPGGPGLQCLGSESAF
jgi:hypothetical protein